MDTFDSTKESLSGLLHDIGVAKTQLPDFQRGWIWDDAHIRSLLASVSLSFPIGAAMMLDTGNPNVRFKPRPVTGVDANSQVEPERLILDGQQRFTSLYQALMLNEPVATRDSRGRHLKRWYYLDIGRALKPNADREEAVVSIAEDRIVRDFRGNVVSDYSTFESECESGMFPLRLAFDLAGLHSWGMQ